ncbi:MAG TPA: acyl carrier protein [Candidatus Limnocylindrales bacterium]|nr:acyl carrier protein [Candidatus Limnocylindrales bacterium]
MTTTFPTLDDFLELLSGIMDNQPVDPGAALAELGVDSLDLLEWSFNLEERHGLRLGDDAIAAIDFGKPLREIYDDLRQAVGSHV